MALVTGTPLGSITQQEDLYVSDGPNIFIQRNLATPLNNPDSDSFYWGLSGTTTYPVFQLGCVSDVVLSESLTLNDVRCDDVGVKATIQQRDYLEVTLTLKTLFPWEVLTEVLKGSAVTNNAGENTSKFGLGKVDNNKFWMVYMPVVYDQDVGDYFLVHFHKAQFVDPFSWNFTFGQEHTVTGVKLRGFADTTKATTQQFATIVRSDISVL